jgi:hypothetical protein
MHGPSKHQPTRRHLSCEPAPTISLRSTTKKFYGGSSFIVKQNVYRNFDFKRATALVDAALALPPVEES